MPLLCVQISAFGDDTSSDGGDVWTVEWDTKAKHWKQDAKVGRHAKLWLAYLVIQCKWGPGQRVAGSVGWPQHDLWWGVRWDSVGLLFIIKLLLLIRQSCEH